MFTKLSVPLAAMALSAADSKFVNDFGRFDEADFELDFSVSGADIAVGGAQSKFEGLSAFSFAVFSGPVFSAGCPNWRVINGKCNNVVNTSWGTKGEFMPRSVSSSQSTSGAGSASVYDSGRWSAMGGANNWGNHDPRKVSDNACRTGTDWNNDGGASVPNDGSRGDGVITYAQVMDHELDATGPDGAYSTASDSGTEYKFGDPATVGGKLKRTHDSAKNGITSYVDAGIVYGEDDNERNRLRSGNNLKYTCLEGSLNGWCGVSQQYLPMSRQICNSFTSTCTTTEMFMANPTKRACFYAGDFRANENSALAGYHTLFARMHNYLAPRARCGCASYDSPSTCAFETTRHKVGYEEQYITYNEWLPAYTGTFNGGSYYKRGGSAVLGYSSGTGGMPNYSGYKSYIRGSTRHIFATATFRQHTGVNHTMKLQNGGNLELDQTYFETCVWAGNTGPGCSSQSGQGGNDTDLPSTGIQNLCSLLVGQTTQVAKKGDTVMVTEERNQLFYKAGNFGNNSEGHSGGFEGFGGDLASLNIFRGRDHNIAGYRAAFSAYFSAGQGPQSTGAIHTYHGLGGSGSNGSINLANAYNSMSAVDVWTGALGEAKLNNPNGGTSMLGAMLTYDVVTQFRDLRDGDRFYRGNWALPGYGAPAYCGAIGGTGASGLQYWISRTTGGYAWTNNGNAFGSGGGYCYHYGTIRRQNVFNIKNECGSGANAAGGGGYGGRALSRGAIRH